MEKKKCKKQKEKYVKTAPEKTNTNFKKAFSKLPASIPGQEKYSKEIMKWKTDIGNINMGEKKVQTKVKKS